MHLQDLAISFLARTAATCPWRSQFEMGLQRWTALRTARVGEAARRRLLTPLSAGLASKHPKRAGTTQECYRKLQWASRPSHSFGRYLMEISSEGYMTYNHFLKVSNNSSGISSLWMQITRLKYTLRITVKEGMTYPERNLPAHLDFGGLTGFRVAAPKENGRLKAGRNHIFSLYKMKMRNELK